MSRKKAGPEIKLSCPDADNQIWLTIVYNDFYFQQMQAFMV